MASQHLGEGVPGVTASGGLGGVFRSPFQLRGAAALREDG